MADFRYLVKRRQTWYVRVAVTPSLVGVVGRTHIVRTLGTRDISEARQRRWSMVAAIQAYIASMAGKVSPTVTGIDDRTLWLAAPDVHPNFTPSLTRTEVSNILVDQAEAIEKAQGLRAAQQYYQVATGERIPLDLLIDRWSSEVSSDIKRQTLQQHLAAIHEFKKASPTVLFAEDVTRRVAGEFVSVHLRDSGVARKTINRKISSLSTFWKWLIRRGFFDGQNPWSLQGNYRHASDKPQEQKERPYTPEELVKLLQGEHAQGWNGFALQGLIPLALLTGARLGELCELRVDSVDLGAREILVTEGKTEAATRRIPVHPIIWSLVEALCAHSPDGWVFPKLSPGGPDGKRSWRVSMRFTEYRRKVLGLDDTVDFHSFRRSFMTYMEWGKLRAPNIITDSLIAELVGHTKATMAGAVYSGGFQAEHRRRAIDLLSELVEPEVLGAIQASVAKQLAHKPDVC